MFTGLIQTLGTVQPLGNGELQIECQAETAATILNDLELGDSVAVDGVCLTVTQILSAGFLAAVSPETLRRSTLGNLTGAAPVNLESSLRVGSKLGGHFVTGHVDGMGRLESIIQTENSWEIMVAVPDLRVSRYIVPKGSIAINGISLTVSDCDADGTWFKVAVIPLTYAETNLQYLQPGSWVNLEGDVLGKYVEKLLRPGLYRDATLPDQGMERSPAPSPAAAEISLTFLTENGYL